jgi:Fe-S cluster assembly protein SufD
MVTRTVISRTRRPSTEAPGSDFTFSPAQIPALQPGWQGAEFVKAYRAQAWEAATRLPLPTVKDEAWRRTDLKSLHPGSFRIEAEPGLPPAPAELLQPLAGSLHGGQIVFQPGETLTDLDETLAAQGVVFCDLETAERAHPELLQRILGQVVRVDEGKFAALAGALARQGVFVYVPRGVSVEAPLHSVLWGPGAGQAYFSHLLVYVEDGASLTYVHEAASPSESSGQTFHAGIVEIHVGQGANLRFVELQSWGEHVYNFSHERAVVERDGNLDWIFGAIGSHLTKNFSDLDLRGQGAVGRMSGFYFTDGDQHLDHDTQQNHLAPHTSSDLLFKGALKDRSHSVWQGMIYVAPGAQKTDGYQANRNLVLSSQARADSIPGLEILADDVRCTHGATVGKIDPEQVFYLRSRGMPIGDAERVIVEGFFDPIMQRIPFDGVRGRFEQAIHAKLTKV